MIKNLSRKEFTKELVEHYLKGYTMLVVSVYYRGVETLSMYKFNIYDKMSFEDISRLYDVIYLDKVSAIEYMYIK